MAVYHWTCPFCDRDTTITGSDYYTSNVDLTIQNSAGYRRLDVEFIVCPNPKCKKFTLAVYLHSGDLIQGSVTKKVPVANWRLIPASSAKVFPDYVPQPIRSDYLEACAIRDLSPKASATLSRRCLQGMIRDFWGISKSRLFDEIEAIKDKVDPLTWKAIDAVRQIGNIGAHMEKDINIIVDVEPDEATQLIVLIELLIKDWYLTRHEREERLKAVIDLAQLKKPVAAKPPTP
jgi:hypothetical protein